MTNAGLTRQVQYVSSKLRVGYERYESYVFNLCLKTDSDEDEETRGGKLFKKPASTTGNARLPHAPIVECFVRRLLIQAQVENIISNWTEFSRAAVQCRKVNIEKQALPDGKLFCTFSETNNEWRSRSRE